MKLFGWHQCEVAAQESGLECACANNDSFTVLVREGTRHRWVSMCPVWLWHSKWLSKWTNKSASNFVLSFNIPPWQQIGYSEGLWGQCNECSANKNVAQMLQRWSRFCWKWFLTHSGRPVTGRTPEIIECVWAAINKDRQLTVRELEADLGIPKLLCLRFWCRIWAWNVLWQNSFHSFCYQSERNIMQQLLMTWFKLLPMNQISPWRS